MSEQEIEAPEGILPGEDVSKICDRLAASDLDVLYPAPSEPDILDCVKKLDADLEDIYDTLKTGDTLLICASSGNSAR